MWLFMPAMMFSIFMRRRPLARAAVVGGTAYVAGFGAGAENLARVVGADLVLVLVGDDHADEGGEERAGQRGEAEGVGQRRRR